MQTKVVKRLEQFRVRNSQPGERRMLLLPLSFGISSLSLLAILDGQLQTQLERTGRTGFDLHVVHVALPGADTARFTVLLDAIRLRFPRHIYSIAAPLDEQSGRSEETETGQDTQSMTPPGHGDERTGSMYSYSKLLSSIPSATSRADLMTILLIRTIVSFAQERGCEGVFWGHSTTRLAQKILAETAQGRGFSLPAQISDGASPWGLPFYFPMRDLLKRELTSYARFRGDLLTPLLHEPDAGDATPVASKNGSINALMRQYFDSVENQYPSIVANVVRTAAKLQDRQLEGSKQCRLCKMRFSPSLEPIGLQANGEANGGAEKRLCYGCTSAVPERSYQYLPD